MNSGSFVKGQKRPNQGKRGPGKITLMGREALVAVIEGNTAKLQTWLEQIEKQDGPQAAFKCFATLLEYAIPKRSRHEVEAPEEACSYVVSWELENRTDQNEQAQ
jgi:hypothetical protein